MSKTIEAAYNNGTLVLDEPLKVSNGTAFQIAILKKLANKKSKKTGPSFLSKRLASIAALPSESVSEKFSGRDHDRILYGTSKQK